MFRDKEEKGKLLNLFQELKIKGVFEDNFFRLLNEIEDDEIELVIEELIEEENEEDKLNNKLNE